MFFWLILDFIIPDEKESSMGCALRARHKINSANWVVNSAPVYDEMGRLLDKRLHASNYDGVSAVTTTSNFNYLQSLDYTYNIRNWLTGINDPATCTLQSGDQLVDVFRMQLNYETSVNGSAAQYNGNISSMQWNTHLNGTCSQRQLYMFSYDAGNRLTAAAHRNWNGTAWTDPIQYNESGITYDLNGNLKTYTRRGLTAPSTFGDIDILSYTYGDAQRPDRLTKITDTGDANKGFKHNPPATGNHYAYDGVGNMTTDHHKKITIAYNYLNLPAVITYTDGTNRKIEWTYDANGAKLTKVTSTNGVVNNTKNYVSGIEYMNANLEGIYFAEGRLTPNGASFYYEYSVKDHLGNVRVSFRANGTAIAFIQENHYYPFGLEMEGAWQARVGTENAYQYNSKELNEDFDLNWYDYGARFYDAAVGRWWSVDPLGEKSINVSLYTYVGNNPIMMVDPTGMEGEKSSADDLTNEEWLEASRNGGKGAYEAGKNNRAKERAEKQEPEEKSGVTITVTDEVVGTGNVYAGGESAATGLSHYFEVNIYRLLVSFTGDNGESLTVDFEALKYGVKYKNGKYYYQGFGGFTNLEKEIVINNPTADGKYPGGGANLYQKGKYDLHPQATDIRSIPDDARGRVNFGCIGVCGAGNCGWGGLTDILFASAGMTNDVGSLWNKKRAYFPSMLSKINLTVIIQPFSIPSGPPIPIQKQK